MMVSNWDRNGIAEMHWFRIPLMNTQQEHQMDLTFARVSQISDWGFVMVVCKKIYLEAYINKEYIWLKIILYN